MSNMLDINNINKEVQPTQTAFENMFSYKLQCSCPVEKKLWYEFPTQNANCGEVSMLIVYIREKVRNGMNRFKNIANLAKP